MGVVIAAVLVSALLLGGVMTLSGTSVSSFDSLAGAVRVQHQKTLDRNLSTVQLVSTSVTGGGADLEITLRNTGTTVLGQFSRWDVVLRYTQQTDSQETFRWFSYTATYPPGTNQWTVKSINRDQAGLQPEVFQKGLLDPGEYAILRVKVSPSIKSGTSALAIVGTANGVVATLNFSG